MNQANFWLVIAVTAATAAVAWPATGRAAGANSGPYVGGGIGYNQVDDQTFAFRGSHTSPTQPTVPSELEAMENTGTASRNSYKGNYFFQLVGGYRFESGLRPEFEIGIRKNDAKDVSYPDPDANNSTGSGQQSDGSNVFLSQSSGMFNLWYDLFPSWRIHPYLGGGVGFDRFKLNKQPTNQLTRGMVTNSTTNDTNPGPPVCPAEDCSGPRKSDDMSFAYQLGAGLRWDVLDSVTVGIDYRYIKASTAQFYGFKDQQQTHLDSKYKAQSVMLSANFFFDKPAPPPPPAVPEAVAVVSTTAVCSDGQDNDGDGKIDFPDDPGCTSAEGMDETDPPICGDGKDNDGDGLVDFPNDKGCVTADDGDETDPPPPCMAPESGSPVSLKGCGKNDVIVLRGVNFEFDQAKLTTAAKAILDGVAKELLAYPDIQVEISGHTDARGSDRYNQKLSNLRVASVVSYLVGMGVAADRMAAIGFGEKKPVSDNETDAGRELNRRVELKVTAGGGGIVVESPATPAPAETGSNAEPDAPADVPADAPAEAPQ